MANMVQKQVTDFVIETTDQHIKQLSDFSSNLLVLFFYPKDNTSGCSQEARDFSELHSQFTARNIAVAGVSRDGLKSHQRFIEKIAIPYPLIADTNEQLCQYFDVLREKSMFGRRYIGIERSTFILDAKRQVVFELRKVRVMGHAKEVLRVCCEHLEAALI